ncbi:hypothetical protein LZK75_09705 [Rhizobium leguminosarum]|nr:hypothetical protein LZK75_09705 [Rhizobium leguminosarum]
MGFQFSIEHANIVSYLTIANSKIPVVENRVFLSFFGSLIDVHGYQTSRLISRRSDWIESITQTSSDIYERLNDVLRGRLDDDLVEPEVFLEFTNPLLEYFREYELYALILASDESGDVNARQFFESAARNSEGMGLFLLPDGQPTDFTRHRSDEKQASNYLSGSRSNYSKDGNRAGSTPICPILDCRWGLLHPSAQRSTAGLRRRVWSCDETA